MRVRHPGFLLAAFVLALLGVSLLFQTSRTDPTAAEAATARASVEARKVIPMNRNLEMNNRSRFGWILGDGFEESEPDGTWIMAIDSMIDFRAKPNRRPVEIDLHLLPLTSPVKPYRSFEFSSSADAQSVTVDEKTSVLNVTLKLDGARVQQVRIKCDELVSPLFLRIGPDRRPMCAKLLWIRVKAS